MITEKKVSEGKRRNITAIQKKASHLIDRYAKAKEPEMLWMKTSEYYAVNVGFRLTLLAMKKYGEEAKELLAKTFYDLGYEDGKQWLTRVKTRGGDINDLRELNKEFKRHFPFHYPQWEKEVSKNKLILRIPMCHMGLAMREWQSKVPESMRDPRYWLCFYDFGLAEAYNPNIKLSRPKCIVAGDPHCEYVFEISG